MKKLNYLLAIACMLSTFPVFAQQPDKHENEKVTRRVNIGIITITTHKKADSTAARKVPTPVKYPKFTGLITFSRIDWGFARLSDNGSGTLSPANDFLDYRPGKSSYFGFDVLELGLQVNKNFKVFTGAGFNWTMIRLRKDITLSKDKTNPNTIEYTTDPVHYNKNRLSNSYIRLPLMLQYKSNLGEDKKNFAISAGPAVEFLLNGKVKQVSAEYGKVKIKDDYRFQQTQVSGEIRITYGGLGLYGKTYFRPLFTTAQQDQLKSYSIGLTLGL